MLGKNGASPDESCHCLNLFPVRPWWNPSDMIPHVHVWACLLYISIHICIVTKVSGLSLGGPFSGLAMNRPKAVSQSTMSHMRKGNLFTSNSNAQMFSQIQHFPPDEDNTALLSHLKSLYVFQTTATYTWGNSTHQRCSNSLLYSTSPTNPPPRP